MYLSYPLNKMIIKYVSCKPLLLSFWRFCFCFIGEVTLNFQEVLLKVQKCFIDLGVIMTSTLMLYLKPCLPCLLWQHLKDGHSKLTSQFQNSYFLSRKIEKTHFLCRKTQFLFLMQSDKNIPYAERQKKQKTYLLCRKTKILFLMHKDKYLISDA
jgi:hypothetical protein